MTEYLTEEEVSALWVAVRSLLEDRSHDMTAGPRNVSQLAERMGVNRSRLAHRMRERGRLRIRGAWPSVEALARGLDVPAGEPRGMDVDLLVEEARYEAGGSSD